MTLSEIAAASKIMNGSQLASKIYIGSTLIYSASRLPNGYTELAYISSTSSGGLYIDTGCKLLANTDDILIDFKFNFKGHGKTGTQQSTLFGSQPEVSPYPGFVMRIGSLTKVTKPLELSIKWNIPNRIGWTEGNKYFYLTFEGADSAGNPRFSNTHVTNTIIEESIYITNIPSNLIHLSSVTLFCAYNSSNQPFRYSEADIYYLKLTKGGTVLREFIPARRNSDNEVGLYDILNNVFYPSLGTDSFVGTAKS